MENRIGITLAVKAKQSLFFKYIKDNNLTVDEFSQLIGISKATLTKIIHFKWIPDLGSLNKMHLDVIDKIQKFFNMSISDIFSEELCEHLKNNEQIKEALQNTQYIDKEIELEYLPYYKLPEIEYNQDFDEFDIKDKIKYVLQTLTPREEEVIKLRYGLQDGKECTLVEVAEHLSITRERVRQIEIKAMRKLKHPSRKGMLEKAM